MAAAFGGGMLVGWLITHHLKTRLSTDGERMQQKANETKADKRAIARWEGEGGALLSIKKSGNK